MPCIGRFSGAEVTCHAPQGKEAILVSRPSITPAIQAIATLLKHAGKALVRIGGPAGADWSGSVVAICDAAGQLVRTTVTLAALLL